MNLVSEVHDLRTFLTASGEMCLLHKMEVLMHGNLGCPRKNEGDAEEMMWAE